jgi:hypothetical protein
MNVDDYFTIITFSEVEFFDILETVNVANYYKINNCFLIEIYKDFNSSKLYNKNKFK